MPCRAAASPQDARAALHESELGNVAAASPPDVRRGSAAPSDFENLRMGYAPGSGSALRAMGQRPNRGLSPEYYLKA
jgi:hypothetical protein